MERILSDSVNSLGRLGALKLKMDTGLLFTEMGLAIAKGGGFLIYAIHGKTLFYLGEAILGFWVRRPASDLRQRSSDLQRSCRDPLQTDSADRIMHSDVRLPSDTLLR